MSDLLIDRGLTNREPVFPRLAVTTAADGHGIGGIACSTWCVYDVDETDPPIAEGIVVKWHAEEIAKRCNEYPSLLAELERLREVERCAAGLVRTAHPTDVGKHEVVRQWWDALVCALRPEGSDDV